MIYHERLSKMSNEELIAETREYAPTVGSNYDAELLEGLADRLEAAPTEVPPTRDQIAGACETYFATIYNDPQLKFIIEDSYGCADAVLALYGKEKEVK